MQPDILLTKLFIPRIPQKIIRHENLTNRINKGIEAGNKLTLVSAPAGYGKTTLVLELICSIKRKYAWISLDEGDNDIIQFYTYLINALIKAGLAIGHDIESFLQESQLTANNNTIPIMLINEISQSTDRIVLILDDYHVINSGSIHEAMQFLIEHLPPNLHLIITTREDPPLFLPKLRAHSQLTEIRIDDLRFSKEKTKDFFTDVMGIDLKKDSIEIMTSRTEGWAAGLQLAGLSLKKLKDRELDNFVENFSGSNRYVIDYLVEEVLKNQKVEIKDFLIKTSILDKMTPDLCNYITGRKDSKEILLELECSNLFLIPLDEKREWYRYHHLFADSLSSELDNSEKLILCEKAALWLEAGGLKKAAINYAFKSKNTVLTIKLIENCVEDMFKSGELPTLVKWLDSLPRNMVMKNEILSIRTAWALYVSGDIPRTIEYIKHFDQDSTNTLTSHNRGLLLSLKALLAQYILKGSPAQTLEYAEKSALEALTLLEPWDYMARIATMNTLGGILADTGRTAEAISIYKNAYDEGIKLGYAFITTLSLLYYGENLNVSGRRLDAVKALEYYLEGMNGCYGRPLPFSGIIYIALGGLYYEGNDLVKAKEYLARGTELCKNLSLGWLITADTWLAKIYYANNEKKAAFDLIDSAVNARSAKRSLRRLLQDKETLAELLLREGNSEEAVKIAAECKECLINGSLPLYEQACLVYIKVLIFQNRLDEALQLLERLIETVMSGQRQRFLLTANLLYSKIYYVKKDEKKTLTYMEHALKLAEEAGYIRVILDEDDKILRDILQEMKTGARTFGKKIGSGFVTKQIKNDGSFEQLSERETELLKLIAEGLTNNEISSRLFITINTAQWHISNIYSKLGVRNRTQAINRAKELNLL